MTVSKDDFVLAPFGTWPSPLSAQDLAAAGVSVNDLNVDGSRLVWLQSDPAEEGRQVVWSRDGDGPLTRLSPVGFNARTRVHEYGGGALGVGEGIVLAASWEDQRVHRLDEGRARPVTPEPTTPAGIRWAGMTVLPDGAAFLAIRETHGSDRPRQNTNVHGAEEAVNEIVRVDLASGASTVLVTGSDFVAGPWVNDDASRVAWLQWNHPDMPWDTAELWTATLDGTTLGVPTHVAGGAERGSAVCDAIWAETDRLVFCDDPSGWWNVYAWTPAGGVIRLQDERVDAGGPRWVHDMGVLAVSGERIYVVAAADGGSKLVEVGAGAVSLEGLEYLTQPVGVAGGGIAVIAGGPSVTTGVVAVDPSEGSWTSVSEIPPSPAEAVGARPESITFDTPDGAIAHALYYSPTSASHRGPVGELPPLVVMSHGGPTGAARTSLNPLVQYWVSRGLAVVDVNYRGSVGYGRAYRDALRGNWGLHDVTDCIAAAQHLADSGRADPDRLLIEGGSAGGYTTLLALCTTDTFAAGGSLFGVSDLRALATDTHKFESRYLDSMIGAWPEEESLYVERSPITHVDSLRTPMIVLQGDEDAVVPPSQAEAIVEALLRKKIPHAYLLFEGEQHGFRQPANIVRAIEARLAFYGQILGFEPADDIDLPEFVDAF